MTKRCQKDYTEFTYETEIIKVEPDIAQKICKEFNINVSEARYHVDGTWYNTLDNYPAALLDLYGYVIFNSENNLRSHADIKKKIHISRGIHNLNDYKLFTHIPESVEGYAKIVEEEKSKHKDRNKKLSSLQNIMKASMKSAGIEGSLLKVTIL